MKLVISDAHEGLKAAVRKVISASWQRCRVHFMRNVLVHAPAGQRRVASALVATIFAQTTERAARGQWRTVADPLREHFPKIARLMDEAEDDVLAHMSFPKEHRTKIHSTNPLERLNGEIKRRRSANDGGVVAAKLQNRYCEATREARRDGAPHRRRTRRGNELNPRVFDKQFSDFAPADEHG